MKILRRLRGAIGTATLWSVVWGVAGAIGYTVLGLYEVLQPSSRISVGDVFYMMVPVGAFFLAIYGAMSGAAFAGILAVAERRHRLHELSVRRIAVWGATSGATIILVSTLLTRWVGEPIPRDTIPVLGIMGLLGAGCAAGSLLIARRPPCGPSVNKRELTGLQVDPHRPERERVRQRRRPA